MKPRTRRKFLKTTAAGMAAISLVGTPRLALAQGLKKIRVAEGIRFIGFLPTYVAKEAKFFEQEGLDVDILVAGSRTLAVQSVLAKEALFSCHDPAGAALARKKGAKMKVFMPVANRAQVYMMVTSDRPIGSPPDLRGLNIALASPPWTGHAMLMDLLRKQSYKEIDNATWQPPTSSDPKDQVKLTFVNFFTEMPQVYARRANAIVVLPPYEAIAERELGMKLLVPFSVEAGPFLFTTWDAADETLDKDADTVQRFSNALVKSYRWAHKNSDQVVKIAEKWFPALHPKVVELAVRRMISEGVYPTDASMSREAFDANFNGLLVRAKDPAATISFEELVDTRFAERADRLAK